MDSVTIWNEEQHAAGRFLMISCLTLLFWDWILTLPREIHLFRHVSSVHILIKAVAVFIRYFTLVTYALRAVVLFDLDRQYFSDDQCSSLLSFQTWAGFLIIAAAELLIVYRIWELYDKTRTAARITGGLVISIFIACAVILATAPKTVRRETLSPCIFTRSTRHVYLHGIILTAEGMALLLLMWNAFWQTRGFDRLPFWVIFRTHGFAWHLLILVSITLNLTAPSISVLVRTSTDSGIFVALMAICASRLLIPREDHIQELEDGEGMGRIGQRGEIIRRDIIIHRCTDFDEEDPLSKNAPSKPWTTTSKTALSQSTTTSPPKLAFPSLSSPTITNTTSSSPPPLSPSRSNSMSEESSETMRIESVLARGGIIETRAGVWQDAWPVTPMSSRDRWAPGDMSWP